MRHDAIIYKTIDVVVAYISNNHVAPSEVPMLIEKIHDTLEGIVCGNYGNGTVKTLLDKKQIENTIQKDFLISLIDGRRYKTLRRHLKAHGLTPERYKEKYALPENYPIVSANYSAVRSRIAKEIKFGQKKA